MVKDVCSWYHREASLQLLGQWSPEEKGARTQEVEVHSGAREACTRTLLRSYPGYCRNAQKMDSRERVVWGSLRWWGHFSDLYFFVLGG